MNNFPQLPSVSIIIPVYNGKNTVERCLNALLAQNYPKELVEIIFVDNKSKDGTLAVLQPYAKSSNILILSENTILNAYGARNTGLRVSKGKIIAFTDADCIPDTNWVKEIVNSFDDPLVGCVSGDIVTAPPINIIDKYYKPDIFLAHVTQTKNVLGGNCAFRREIFNLVGYYREDIPSGGDVELPIRMQNQTDFIINKNHQVIVIHQHTVTLLGLIKQQMRYGTSRRLIGKSDPGWAGTKHIGYLMIFSLRNFYHFIKKILKILLNIDQDRKEDQDIYLLRPLLNIVTGWAPIIGYYFAVRFQKLLR